MRGEREIREEHEHARAEQQRIAQELEQQRQRQAIVKQTISEKRREREETHQQLLALRERKKSSEAPARDGSGSSGRCDQPVGEQARRPRVLLAACTQAAACRLLPAILPRLLEFAEVRVLLPPDDLTAHAVSAAACKRKRARLFDQLRPAQQVFGDSDQRLRAGDKTALELAAWSDLLLVAAADYVGIRELALGGQATLLSQASRT